MPFTPLFPNTGHPNPITLFFPCPELQWLRDVWGKAMLPTLTSFSKVYSSDCRSVSQTWKSEQFFFVQPHFFVSRKDTNTLICVRNMTTSLLQIYGAPKGTNGKSGEKIWDGRKNYVNAFAFFRKCFPFPRETLATSVRLNGSKKVKERYISTWAWVGTGRLQTIPSPEFSSLLSNRTEPCW